MSNKPTIPTVNNATLKIQKNGTDVATFTANASSNVTANISVPTKVSQLTNDSGFLTSHQDLSGYIPLTGTSALAGSIVPSTDDVYQLGSTAKNLNTVFTGKIVGNGNNLNIYSVGYGQGALIALDKNDTSFNGAFRIYTGTTEYVLQGNRTGTLTWGGKNLAMQEDVVPRSGGAVLSGSSFSRTVNNNELQINGGTGWSQGASIALAGKDKTGNTGVVYIHAADATSYNQIEVWPKGSVIQNLNGTIKHVAITEDVIPRSGGAVMTGNVLGRISSTSYLHLCGGTGFGEGAVIALNAKGTASEYAGVVTISVNDGSRSKSMNIKPDGTWTWNGTACQITSDQRLKQQIAEIDDKLLDAWEDVDLVQFKYNDAVDQKGDTARLHTGYVVQQIEEACKSHNLDISAYGLYCHEEYPERTEEVTIENEDGTTTKETKVIEPAKEHYSLRYTETLVVECAYLRKQIKELKERLEKLEGNSK